MGHPVARARGRALGLALPALLGALLACGGAPPARPARGGRVLLVGLDGASPRVVEPLLAQGRLPHLAEIARAGASGRLRSFAPFFSPRIWTTVATGKTPQKHGIRAFVVEAQGESPRRLQQSGDRSAHALWNIASEAGLSVAVVNWWTTQPPERVRGVMVTDHLFPEAREEQAQLLGAPVVDTAPNVYPEDWLPRVREIAARETALTSLANPFEGAQGLPEQADAQFLSARFRFDQTVTRIALELESALRPDLVMVLLPGIDKVSHYLWGALEPEELYPPGLRFTPEARAQAVAAIHRYYEYSDALVGLLAARFGPQDLVLVLSDHGFHAGSALGRLTGLHKDRRAEEAVIFARGPGIAPGSPAGAVTVNDVTPTVLAWLGLPLGADMDGRPAPFLAAPPPAVVATWDTRPIERVGVSAPEVEARVLEELESLGYFESP
jgi:predicted AlkP superfamily phosphohydrolase/phosphomutase